MNLKQIEKDPAPRGEPAPCSCEWECGSWDVCEKHRADPSDAPWLVGAAPGEGHP